MTMKEIRALKKEKNAIILAHNYQRPEVQDVADFIGDSLGLARKATEAEEDIIVFCGVRFMAETAVILNPKKKVIHPDPESMCPMAAMITPEGLKALKAEHPDAVVVSYVNTTADVKAESDICCTSANAVDVVRSVDAKKIIFTPDRNLGQYVQRFVKDKEIILWPGYCPTHQDRITVGDIQALKNKHPDAEILVHPECTPEVIDAADHAFSTEGMVKHVEKSKNNAFIIGTEKEMVYRLKKEFPKKEFYSLDRAVCPNMKKVTLDKVLRCLKDEAPVVELPVDIIKRAHAPVMKMVEIN